MVKSIDEKNSIKTILEPLFIVNTVAKLHIKLTETATIINHTFCVQILMLITICFVGTVCALFFMVINMTTNYGPESKLPLNIMFIIWVLSNTAELLAVVLATSGLCEEVILNFYYYFKYVQ